jgi:predicted glutamine amidotransferase
MRDIWRRPGEVPPLEARYRIVSSFAEDLRAMGPANFLYSDGETLFAHGDRRKQKSTERVEPPGLVFLPSWCRRWERGFVTSGVSIEGADQTMTLVASVPLTDDAWQEFAQGEIIAISNGEISLRGAIHGPLLRA